MTNKEYISISDGIQLICLPPTDLHLPISGMSTLKSYLEYNNITTHVQYLNLKTDKYCFFKTTGNDLAALLPYIYLYNKIILKDESKANLTRLYIESEYGTVFFKDKSLSDELFEEYIAHFLEYVNKQLDIIIESSPLLIGFTSKFYQWIPACICAYLIKCKNPYIPILIGGWGHKDAALSILKIAPYIDFAIWGEGEIPIVELYKSIMIDSSKNTIPRLVYRDSEPIASFQISGSKTFVNLNTAPIPDFTDYIYEIGKQNNDRNFVFPIERSRGCNWNKCCFCYLSQGYHYRIKDNESFINQIKSLIEKYNIYQFQIMDNDFVGRDINMFIDLLEKLKNLRLIYPQFKITLAEIITRNLSKNIIKYISDSGIELVQIGLEAISQNLLTKIKKNQSVAENIFFIREAQSIGILISGANVIIETPDETEKDIIESIETLYFFRFFINVKNFNLNISALAIANYSNYLKQIKEKNLEYKYSSNEIANLIPNDFSTIIDRFSLFDYIKSTSYNVLWDIFSKSYDKLKENKHTYKIKYKSDSIIYKEYSKRKIIKELCFDDIRMITILYLLQESVLSFRNLTNELRKKLSESKYNLTDEIIKEQLLKLNVEGLVYYNDDLSQITTIIILRNQTAYETCMNTGIYKTA